jgi:hypothetical protein
VTTSDFVHPVAAMLSVGHVCGSLFDPLAGSSIPRRRFLQIAPSLGRLSLWRADSPVIDFNAVRSATDTHSAALGQVSPSYTDSGS